VTLVPHRCAGKRPSLEFMRLQDQIAQELECFPDETVPQRQLRSLFEIHRVRDLGKNSEHPGATALESAGRAVASMRVSDPGFVPEFDRDRLAAPG
jgi:hypothetical protein